MKVLKNEIWWESSKKTKLLKTLEHEIKILQKINHENVIKFEGISLNWKEEKFAIVTEYIEGETLGQILEKKSLTIEESIEIIKQIIEGVAHLHNKSNKPQIIHKDLKPENIMVTEGKVKIIDLGIAGVTTLTNLFWSFKTTAVGKKAGTFLFMAPEVFLSNNPTITTAYDIYSLGLILNQIFSKDPPIGFY